MKSTTPTLINHELLFQSLPVAYIVFAADDPTFTIVEENEAHARIALVKRDNVIGKPLLEAFPDNSESYKKTGISDLVESIQQVIQTKQPDSMPSLNYDVKDAKGQFAQKYWNVTHYPVLDDDGVVTAVYQVTEDVTEKVVMQQKLDQTQYQLNQALSNGSIGTWVWDIIAKKVFADKNLADVFGLSTAEALTGLSLESFVAAIHPDDQARVSREIEAAIQSRDAYQSEYRTINQEGNIRWVIARGRVEVDGTGTPITFPGVIVDITERKAAEHNLNFLNKASIQFSASLDYKTTLSNIADMVVPDMADWCTIDLLEDDNQIQQVAVAHKDPKKVTWAKQLRMKQTAPKIDDSMGVPKVLRTGEAEYYPEITDEILVATVKSKKELALLRSLGFSSVMIVPLIIDDKTIGAISFIAAESRVHYELTDLKVAQSLAHRAALAVENSNLYTAAQREIKERKRLQYQLETVNEGLETRVKGRTRQLETTNRGLEKEIDKRHKIERELQEYSDNLEHSNQELQDFAYVASHDLQEPLRKIQAFGDLLQTEYGDRLGDGNDYLTRMRGAASRMSGLIQDLLSFSRVSTSPNAVHYVDLNTVVQDVVNDLEVSIGENNGTVTVSELPDVCVNSTHMRQLFQNLIGNALKFHRPDVPPVITINATPLESHVLHHEILVTDNGIGFDEKYLDRIFSVFQRLHTRGAYEGTGIGLAVCRKIVERYDGTINASSKVGAGSTFIITIPITQKENTHGDI